MPSEKSHAKDASNKEERQMSESRSASQTITDEVASWPGVAVDTGEIGEVAFTVGRRQIGHLHGDDAAHFSVPKREWHELRAQGRIVPHPVFPDRPGWAERAIRNDADVRDVIELFRSNYERAVARKRVSAEREAS
jgi:hypothetical protein